MLVYISVIIYLIVMVLIIKHQFKGYFKLRKKKLREKKKIHKLYDNGRIVWTEEY